MRNHRNCRALLGIVAMTMLGGCAVGSQDFSCPDVPTGMACTSTRDVYDRTEGANVAAETQSESDEAATTTSNRADRRGASSSGDTNNAEQSVEGQADKRRQRRTARAPIRQQKQLPIREPSQVMRIWVAPWEDEGGNLHMSGLIYTEIVKRRWSIGVPGAEDSGIAQPLRALGVRNPERPKPQTESAGGQ